MHLFVSEIKHTYTHCDPCGRITQFDLILTFSRWYFLWSVYLFFIKFEVCRWRTWCAEHSGAYSDCVFVRLI